MQHIVLLEDNANDAELIERVLVSSGIEAHVDVAPDRAQFEHLLCNDQIDLVISDSAVGNFTALDAVQMTKRIQPLSEFIIVSGGIDEARAEQARCMGAIEWLRKTELKLLPPLARMALDATGQVRLQVERQDESLMGNASAQRLVQAVTELSKARDIESVQRIVRTAAREINGADGATFVLRDGNQCYYADEDAIQPLWKGQRFPMANCISGWAMINRRPAIIPDITLDSRIPQDAYRPTFVKSLVMVPIRTEAPIGAIGNYWAHKHSPSASEVQFIQALADSASVALENVHLYQQLERRVAQRTQQLLEANQSLQEFSYFVSHDLRSPIRHISAYANILEEELGATSPQVKSSLSKIKSSSVTMSSMLEGLLALAQLGAAAIETNTVNMNAVAKATSQIACEQCPMPVKVAIDNLPDAQGSEVLLRQVWVNLLTNAVKFSNQCPNAAVFIGSEQIDGETRYFVRDNGVGFDMHKADQLFTAFRRLHSDTAFPGIGVGLAIVNRIVTRHGGRVWAQSTPGEGATFYFTLGSKTRTSVADAA